jgi:hypothetical protein
MATYKNINITENFLNKNTNSYFVFGDNLQRIGMGGAASLRYHPRSIGFITKKFPDNDDGSFYKPFEYEPIFEDELRKLKEFIDEHPNYYFYISKLGSGLGNRFKIWENVIEKRLINQFSNYKNVIFCW